MARFVRVKNLSPWRKLALVFWKSPVDPTVYGWYDFDVTTALDYLAKQNANSPVKLTLTHYVARAMAITIAKYPMINGIIRWGHIYLRQSIDILLQVAIQEIQGMHGDQLSGAKINNIDKKSIVAIAEELSRTASNIRNNKDPQFNKQFAITRLVPNFVLKGIIKLNEFLVYDLGLSCPALGFVDDPFGSAMLTSVGSLDCPPGLAPLVPPSRCPFLICIGRVEKKPWVVPGVNGENDRIEVKPVMRFTATFDHRFLDGLTASKMFKTFLEVLYNPDKYF
jgi:pyruvate dehydrogenase E2 component (dihydrolipoamide acetyltransferase)